MKSLLLLIFAISTVKIWGQTPNFNFGGLAPPGPPIDVPFPPGTPASFIAGIRELRDSVYDFLPTQTVDKLSTALNKAVGEMPFNPITAALVRSRIADLTGRSWNEHGDKQKAVAQFELAWEQAKIALAAGETPLSLMASVRAISSLCMVKDVTFVVTYGPRISPYAQKTLDLEPGNSSAAITLAAAKAYPPTIFGGNPKKAIAEIADLIQRHPAGFEKHELFDLRACVGTAYAKLGDIAQALAWFDSALELYPGNQYIRDEKGKLAK